MQAFREVDAFPALSQALDEPFFDEPLPFLGGQSKTLSLDSINIGAGTSLDVLIQLGTNHAWVNNSDKPCRIAFVLIDAKEPPAWKVG